MLIKVIKTTKAASCPMGVKTKIYLQDKTYDIHDSLAEVFINEGWGRAAHENTGDEIKSHNDKLRAEKEELLEEAEVLEIEGLSQENSIEEIKEAIELKKEEIKAEEENKDSDSEGDNEGPDEENKDSEQSPEEEKDGEKSVEKTENKAVKKSPKNKSFADNKNINNKKGK